MSFWEDIVDGIIGSWRPVTGIAVDLGTGNTLVYVKGHGVVINEPSVVAVERGSRKVVAIGKDAKMMLGKTHGDIDAIRPMRDGVIGDVDVTEIMLRHFLREAVKERWFRIRPRLIVGVPSGITEMEKRAVRESSRAAGARDVYMLAEPMAAAIGVGLPVHSPTASMVVDIGGGTSEIAVIALGGIVADSSIKVAGDEIDEAIISHIRKTKNLLIGQPTAERVKMEIASAWPMEEERSIEVKGRDLVSGNPVTVTVTSQEVRECIADPVGQIVAAVRRALEVTPPELAADIVDNGIVLTGGGALIRGLDKLIEHETGLKIVVDEDPLDCVIRGTAIVLDEFDKYRNVCMI